MWKGAPGSMKLFQCSSDSSFSFLYLFSLSEARTRILICLDNLWAFHWKYSMILSLTVSVKRNESALAGETDLFSLSFCHHWMSIRICQLTEAKLTLSVKSSRVMLIFDRTFIVLNEKGKKETHFSMQYFGIESISPSLVFLRHHLRDWIELKETKNEKEENGMMNFFVVSMRYKKRQLNFPRKFTVKIKRNDHLGEKRKVLG